MLELPPQRWVALPMMTRKPKRGLPDLALAHLKQTTDGLLSTCDSHSSRASARPAEFTSAQGQEGWALTSTPWGLLPPEILEPLLQRL